MMGLEPRPSAWQRFGHVFTANRPCATEDGLRSHRLTALRGFGPTIDRRIDSFRNVICACDNIKQTDDELSAGPEKPHGGGHRLGPACEG